MRYPTVAEVAASIPPKRQGQRGPLSMTKCAIACRMSRARKDIDPDTPMGRLLGVRRAVALALMCASVSAAMSERLAKVTAYTPSIEGGGAGTGLTSTGIRTDHRPHGVAACPTMIPYGSVVRVPGYRESPDKGGPFHYVDDTGAAMRKSARDGVLHIDLRMRHVASARAWGVRWLVVTIYTPDKE